MIKIFNLIFLVVFLFFLFTYNFYSSNTNIKNINVNRSNIENLIKNKTNDLPILKDDTSNVIEFNSSFSEELRDAKPRNFWDLLKIE